MPVNYGLLQVAPNRISGNLSLATPQTDDTLQKAASGVASTANSFLKELVDQANRTRVQDAINQYSEDLDHFKYDRDTGMMRRKGRDVALPESGEAFSVEGERGVEERIGKYFGGLNQAQQDLAKDFLSRTRASNRNDFLRHEAAECDNYTVDVSDAAIKRARNSLAQNGMFPEARAADIQTIRDSYAAIGRIRGWSDEHVKNSADEAISGSIKDVIGVLLDDGNVAAATKLFNDEGRNGNLLGRDMIGLRKRITKMREAAAQKAKVDALVQDLAVASSSEMTAINALREEGFSLPALDGLLAAEKDPRKKLRIQREWFGKLLKTAGGDTRKALWAAVDAETASEDVDEETVKRIERAAKKAGTRPTYEVPSVGEVMLRIKDLRPDLPEEEIKSLAGKAHKSWEAHIGAQALMADAQLDRAFKALDSGKGFESLETDRLTAPMVRALQRRSDKAAAGALDVRDDATYYSITANPEKLARMTESQVRAAAATCSDAQVAKLLQLRQNVVANGGKIQYTKTARIRQAFDLALPKDSPLRGSSNKAVYEQRVAQVAARLQAMERENGQGIDDRRLNELVLSMVQQPIFFLDGPTYGDLKDVDFSKVKDAEDTLTRFCRQRQSIANPNSYHFTNAAWQILSANPDYQMTIGEARKLLPIAYGDAKLEKTYGDRLKEPNGLWLVADFLRATMHGKAYVNESEQFARNVLEREKIQRAFEAGLDEEVR